MHFTDAHGGLCAVHVRVCARGCTRMRGHCTRVNGTHCDISPTRTHARLSAYACTRHAFINQHSHGKPTLGGDLRIRVHRHGSQQPHVWPTSQVTADPQMPRLDEASSLLRCDRGQLQLDVQKQDQECVSIACHSALVHCLTASCPCKLPRALQQSFNRTGR
jgi:hypothetical protein